MTRPEMKSIHHIASIVFVAMLMTAGGCTADLKPAMTADRVPGLEDAAATTAKGVTLQVQAGHWPGPDNIKYEVTPLRIRIENNSGQPLRVRYNEFTLTASDGSSYSALPLIKIKGNVMVAPEDFYHDKFTIAPYYSRYYPDIEPFTNRYEMDRPYYDSHILYWDDMGLPTPAMISRVIPEGVVADGGRLAGWLFFERVNYKLDAVIFRADLVNADSGRKFAEARIPFRVE